MHGRRLGYFNDQRAAPRRLRHGHPEQTEVERQLHAVRADLRHEVGQRIQLRGAKSLRLALVGHAENKPPASAIGQRRQPVG